MHYGKRLLGAALWVIACWATIGSASAVGESQANPAGRAVYSALYKELTGKRGLAQKPAMLARSRGGLMLYNWAAENPSSVSCVAGIYPVCNLASYPGMKRASQAFGMSEKQLGGEMPLEMVKGGGHDMAAAWFHNQKLVDFIIKHATASK